MLSSVDSLESANGGIIIQVLGELSNHGAPSQKFAQTFFLAEQQQPKGYYALNNIFRYIKEDIDSDLDDANPASPNEIDRPMSSHDIQHSIGLTNGYHSAARSLLADDGPLQPMAMQYSLESIGSPMDAQMEIEQKAPSDVLDDFAEDLAQEMTASTQTASEIDVASDHAETVNLETDPVANTSDLDSHQESIPTMPVEVPTQVSIPVRPSNRTWATLAATNADKWLTQGEQRSTPSGIAPPAKSNGNLPPVRKEAAKPTQQGMFDLYVLLTSSENQEPALGYIKHVGSKTQKTTLSEALVKFGPLKDLDINRQKVTLRSGDLLTHSGLWFRGVCGFKLASSRDRRRAD
jgi:Nuclear transport factor 2 (NTF2) domain